MSAYETVKTAIEGVLPAGWKFVEYEATTDTYPDVTAVTMKVRTITRLPEAPIGEYRVDWVLTITTEYPERERADPQLFDDLIDFVGALDTIGPWFGWTESEKALNEDGRLAYDITVRTHTQKEEA